MRQRMAIADPGLRPYPRSDTARQSGAVLRPFSRPNRWSSAGVESYLEFSGSSQSIKAAKWHPPIRPLSAEQPGSQGLASGPGCSFAPPRRRLSRSIAPARRGIAESAAPKRPADARATGDLQLSPSKICHAMVTAGRTSITSSPPNGRTCRNGRPGSHGIDLQSRVFAPIHG